MKRLLLIDDAPEQLEKLRAEVAALLGDAGDVATWVPTIAPDLKKAFGEALTDETALVVTDRDLSTQCSGLFGSSVVEWCQERLLPVAEYTAKFDGLPKEPDLLEVIVPNENPAKFIANVFRGFVEIERRVLENGNLLEMPSPAAVLAKILERPAMESELSRYVARFAANRGPLMRFVKPHSDPDQRARVLVYLLGHVLLNSVLRFAGPIVSARSLASYLATTEEGAMSIQGLFASARYAGPFSEGESAYFWLEGVDDVLNGLGRSLDDVSVERTVGEVNRSAVEVKVGTALPSHGCEICNGVRGGFHCPFTARTVCQRPDCSVGANSWIPQGARLCRIRKAFFDEWAPILGL